MSKIPPSELVLAADGSIYHLRLKPENIADTILVAGDPKRVAMISSRFEQIDFKIQNREFVTHTGFYKGKRLTAMSTGIGTDNIDIVLNELDAVVNVDLKTREPKNERKSLTIVRLGTSGALQKDIPVDSVLVSEKAIGFDGLLHFYQDKFKEEDKAIARAFKEYSGWPDAAADPYVVSADTSLFEQVKNGLLSGITATAPGFYAPQGRSIVLEPAIAPMDDILSGFAYGNLRITNFEMETSALYGLSALLGHRACTVCAIIANRISNRFSDNPSQTVDRMIDTVLNNLTV